MKMLLIALICLLMTGCADEYIVIESTTTTPEEKPLNEVQMEVEVKPEIYTLNHFIDFDPMSVSSVTVQEFSFGPSVSERETVMNGMDAQNFAKQLAEIKVTDFDPYSGGQGMTVTRYTLQLNDGTSYSFCEDGAIFVDDSIIPSQRNTKETICSRVSTEELGFPLGQNFTWYDYIDGERLARHREGNLDGYIPGGIGPLDVVEVTVQEYLATSDSHGTFIEREYHLAGDELLKGDAAEVAAEILKNTTVYGPNAMTEQMGLAGGTRYTLHYWHGYTQSFCVDKAVFLSDVEPAWYHNALDADDCELLCVLAESNFIDLPIPEDTVITTYYHMNGQKLTEEEFNALPTLTSLIDIVPKKVTSMEIHRFYKENESVWKLEEADAVFAAEYLANSIRVSDEICEAEDEMIFRYIIRYEDGSEQSFCVSDVVFTDENAYPSYKSAEILGSVLYDTGVPIPYEISPVDHTWMNGQLH